MHKILITGNAGSAAALLPLINEDEEFVPVINGYELVGAGSAAPSVLKVPYGDVPYDRDGYKGLQRLNQTVAQKLCEFWNAVLERDPRGLAGVPIYVGHPDYVNGDAKAASDFLRSEPGSVGWITAINAGADALELSVDWTPEGAELVNSKAYRFFSPYFLSGQPYKENGVNIFELRFVCSAGITNKPNWPMPPMVNADTLFGGEALEGKMNELLNRLLALINKDDVKTEDEVFDFVAKLIESAKALRESVDAKWKAEDAAYVATANSCDINALVNAYLAATDSRIATINSSAELVPGLQKQLQDSRKAHATLLVNSAVADGRLLQDHAAKKIVDLVNAGDEFGSRVAELNSLPPLMKTKSETDGSAERAHGVVERRSAISDLVNSKMAGGQPYDNAFAAVRKERPDLFAADDNAKTV